MEEEIIDIVDENDNVIGQDTKVNAHTQSKWHRSAGFLLFKDNSWNEVLVIKRAKNQLLAIPAGHLLKGESYLHGGLRELHEEMLVNKYLPDVDITALFRMKTKESKEFILIYRIAYPGPFQINEEIAEYHFVSIRSLLKDMKDHPDIYDANFRDLMDEYVRKGFLNVKGA
ncbi:MAG: NUDIX domain-containing protein [Candidatus Woesearchaeota archaeon]|jgi:isopentenyldiphosphate isomerase